MSLINGSYCTEHHVYLCDECRIADFKEQIGSLTARLAQAQADNETLWRQKKLADEGNERRTAKS